MNDDRNAVEHASIDLLVLPGRDLVVTCTGDVMTLAQSVTGDSVAYCLPQGNRQTGGPNMAWTANYKLIRN